MISVSGHSAAHPPPLPLPPKKLVRMTTKTSHSFGGMERETMRRPSELRNGAGNDAHTQGPDDTHVVSVYGLSSLNALLVRQSRYVARVCTASVELSQSTRIISLQNVSDFSSDHTVSEESGLLVLSYS